MKMRRMEQTRDWINKDYNDGLKKLAVNPIEFEIHQQGLSGRIETKDGVHITSYIHLVLPQSPVTCICGAFAERPIPSSMLVKNVRVGLRKRPFFLPHTASPTFSAKEVYRNKPNWSPLLDRLNQDEPLLGLIKSLPTETSVAVSVKKDFMGDIRSVTSQVFKIDDRDDSYDTVCQCIPFKDKTLVATRHMVKQRAPVVRKHIETAVKAISRVRGHVMEHGYRQPTTGSVPQPWAFTVLELLK